MKRWLGIPFVFIVLAVAGFVAWTQWFTPAPPQNSPSPHAQRPTQQEPPRAIPLDPAIAALVAEFDAHQGVQPRAESMKTIKALAGQGAKGPLPATLVEAWLHRMHEAKLSDTPEFGDLAQALLAVDPAAPQKIVVELNRQDVVVDRTYHAATLVAFQKHSVPALVDGLAGVEGQEREAQSILPLVLALFGNDALPDLRKCLTHKRSSVRRQALRSLAIMGSEKAAPALPDVEAVLQDQDMSVRTLAVLAVGELGNHAAAPPAALTAALQDSDPVLRLAAAKSLSGFRSFDRKQLVAVLVNLLKSGDFNKAAWGVGVFADIRRPYAESKGGLFYNAMYWEEATAHLLIDLGPDYCLPPETLLAMLKECPHDGRHIVHMLALQGEAAKKVVPELAGMLKDKDSRQRRRALLALGRLGKGIAGEALPEVRAALHHTDGRTRWRAFLTLALLDPADVKQSHPEKWSAALEAASGSATHPRLDKAGTWTRLQWTRHAAVLLPATSEGADAFKQGEPWTLSDEEVWIEKERVDAMLTALEKAGPLGKEGVDLLLPAWLANNRALSDRQRHGDKALTLLTREGALAAPALSSMIYALSWYEPQDLAKSFVKIGDVAVPELARALDNPEIRDLQPAILAVLQEFGPKSSAALPTVVKLLSCGDEEVARQAAETLGAAGAGTREVIPELRKLITSPDPDVRRHAVDALGLIGSPAKEALPDLTGLFGGESQQLRVVAIRAVGRFGKDAVGPLTAALDDKNPQVRLGALQVLVRLGADAEPALPAVRNLDRDDQPPEVREVVRQLLK
jgi:HEAT repeat protein